MQLCSLCEEHDDIVLLKVDWDQNKPIARPLGVKVSITRLGYCLINVTSNKPCHCL